MPNVVWVEGSLGNAAARLDERAYVHGSFGEVEAAYFVSQDKLEWPV